MRTKIKTLCGILAGMVLFIAVCKCLDYIYVPDSDWERKLFHSYYTQTQNIDDVVLGSSHVYHAVKPSVLDTLSGENYFNMSTPGQRWDNTYYLLKQIAKENDLKHVYLECYYACNVEYEIWDSDLSAYKPVDYLDDKLSYSKAWLNSYYMKPSINKWQIQMKAASMDHALENLFPFVRNRETVFEWSRITDNMAWKKDSSRNAYQYYYTNEADGVTWHTEYQEKGFQYVDKTLRDDEKFFEQNRDLTKYSLGSKSEKYMHKVMQFCRKNDIQVTLFTAPIYNLQVISTEGYDSYYQKMVEFAEEYDTEYYDFNLIKDQYLDIQHGEYYKNMGHLNNDGAELFTRVFWNVINNPVEENTEWFYDSYEEKLLSEEPEIYGIYYDLGQSSGKIENDENGNPNNDIKECTIASNRKTGAEYKVTRTYNVAKEDGSLEKKEEVIQDYSANKKFAIPDDEEGTITITGRFDENPDEEYRMTIVY